MTTSKLIRINNFKQALSDCESQDKMGFCQVSVVTLMLFKCKNTLKSLKVLRLAKAYAICCARKKQKIGLGWQASIANLIIKLV